MLRYIRKERERERANKQLLCYCCCFLSGFILTALLAGSERWHEFIFKQTLFVIHSFEILIRATLENTCVPH